MIPANECAIAIRYIYRKKCDTKMKAVRYMYMYMKVAIWIVIDCFTASHKRIETPNTSTLIHSYSDVYVLLRRVAWSCQREKHIGQASMRWSTFCSRVSRAFNRRPFVILYSVRNIAVSISGCNLVRSSDAQALGAWVTNGRHTRYLFCFNRMFRNFDGIYITVYNRFMRAKKFYSQI